MNTSNNNIVEFVKEKLAALREFIAMYLRLILPIGVALIALIVIIVSVSAHNSKKEREEAAAAAENEVPKPIAESLISADSSIVSVPEMALEEDAYPEVNELVRKYYLALAAGDVDTAKKYNNNIDDTESIRITETAKYVDSYKNIKVYTKLGPAEGTYLAYVYYEEKFFDYDQSIPGLEAFYICTDENGELFINDGEESESVINYIREESLQDDVVDLNNKVASAYNNMLTENEDLSIFLVDLTESIDTAVGESLAQVEGDVTETAEAEPEEEEETPAVAEIVKTVRTTTTVNIRSSDSETADKLGKAAEGDEFTLIEKQGNGWTEISYNGKSAFIKSDYLEDASVEAIVNNGNDDDDNDNDDDNATAATNNTADNKPAAASGTVTVTENVRIRATAGTDGEKIGTAYVGQKLDFVEKMSNGWTKIKYNGQTAYVKSEYVE